MMRRARKIFMTISKVFIVLFVLGALLVAGYGDSDTTGFEYGATILLLIDCTFACSAGICYFIAEMLK